MPEVHPPSPDRSVLARFLRERREAILSAWAAAGRRCGLVPMELDREALIDHLPLLLERMAAGAEAGAGPAMAESVRPAADAHAADRLRLGLDLGDLVVEYALLRRTILEQAAAAGLELPAEERIGFHEALDAAMIRPVAQRAASHTKMLEAMDRVSADAMAGGDLDRVLRRLLAVAVEHLEPVDRAAILLLEGDTAHVRAALGLEETPTVPRTYRAADGLLAEVCRDRRPRVARVRTADALGLGPPLPGPPTLTVDVVPLLTDGRVLGVAVIGSSTAAEFVATDLAQFRTLAERAAVLAERRRADAERDRLLEETRRALARAEEARRRLEEAETLTAAFFENAPAVIFVKDLDGRYTFVNRRPAEELDLSTHDYLGRDDEEVFAGKAAEAIRANDLRVLESRSTLIAEERVPSPGGGYRTYLSVKFPLLDRDGRPYALGGISTDITERKRAEAAREFLADASAFLAESLDYEATLRKVVELGGTRFADYCILDLREDGVSRRLATKARDPGMEAILERSKAFAHSPGGPNPLSRVFEGEPLLIAHMTPTLLDRIARSPEHRELLAAAAPVSLLAVPLAIRGKVFGILLAGTTRRALDQEDLTVAIELGRRAALAIESARLYREVREAVRAREEFLSIAAHELKTPLTSLHLHLQTMRRGLCAGTVDPGKLDLGLQRAIDQSTRLAKLLDHLLDLSRATAGRLVLEREAVDLASLVHDVVGRLGDPLAAAGCATSVRVAPGLVGHWDRIRVEQVLTNLLSNAIRYAPGKPVEVEADRVAECACLRVRDHGPGLSGEASARIFSPYQRASESLAAGGLGLGLYITKQIVEAHGGTIRVETTPGEGATFFVRLPFAGVPCSAEPGA